ncbi:hypothetical protein L0F63_001868 [Massospora cicadina]|nr:hypothetical protein L0F63_001868 [Massospora cicadina]
MRSGSVAFWVSPLDIIRVGGGALVKGLPAGALAKPGLTGLILSFPFGATSCRLAGRGWWFRTGATILDGVRNLKFALIASSQG